MIEEKKYRLWLMNIPGAGGKTKRKLLEEFGSARAAYQAPEKELQRLLKPKQMESLRLSVRNWDILAEYEKLKKRKIEFTCYGDRDYPKRLLQIPDAPFALYYQGEIPSDDFPAVAVVGARACSEYGRYAAREFGSKLAAAGIQIISGLAMGIDGISQEAALLAGGKSFGILGNGVDICYPESNRFLYEKLRRQGGILSEYAPGTAPRAGLFPPRNRIISGLSDAVLVIEAKEKSGTLITVDMALEQGREVFAVPGRITDALSRGCNRLLRQGAGVAVSPEDILEALYGIGCTEKEKQSFGAAPYNIEEIQSAGYLSEKEKRVFALLGAFSRTPEEIYADLQGTLPIQEILETLVELCLRGLIEQEAEGGYRKKSPCILK